MVLQHIDGRTLRDYVQEFGRQDQGTALRWAIELSATLKDLHNLEPPVIHRDLTPDNIIIRKDGSLCVIDFGAANTFLGTATCTIVGKSAYIPLEQFQGKAKLCSDIYALGGTLYFLVTGRDPEALMASDPREARGEDAETDITSEEKDANESVTVSDTVAELIFSCTQMEESDRPGKLEDIENTLKALIPKKEEKERESG